ncbi:peptidoglycan-binding domain-containing protein [Sediminicoccus rosea]|jgi:peptidoglycan hydrolase-like protein with peptidoglycan-binding domain|uniref:Peptidoglycan-binding domain-containing protein n=1 Tax=Sediminicoccus rosea TaxID=1225128 RepID=A0ABZ0PM01_9PROT|nr:peptidoglycan-binding domain-containing protein [Sediminicoccus rosea]WPB86348.1 peptidoglycan-binding domain-containing protein [Sediminicoccus rosea]
MRTCHALAALLFIATPGLAAAQAPAGLIYTQALSGGVTAMVQEKLQQAGVYAGRADGVWGPESQAALERFQQTRNLQVTGQLNQATAATLGIPPAELLSARNAPAAATTAPPALETVSPAVIRNVQQRLRALGFYRGGVDGIWGAGTQASLERFQQGRGLQPTGQVNPITLQALGLDPNAPAARPR